MTPLPRLSTLFEAAPDAATSGATLPARLRELYGGELRFPPPGLRPYVFCNFVSTLDGVVSFALPGQAGGGAISGGDAGDRFVMGLLRAAADAIIVGAGTLREVPADALFRPEQTCPEAKPLYDAYRNAMLGRREPPLLVVVSGSGRLDLDHAVFRTPGVPALIFTTAAGGLALTRAGAARLDSVEVRVLPAGALPPRAAPQAMLDMLQREFQVRRLLHEGGPHLIGEFLRAGLLDEMFLTLAPQIAGRGHGPGGLERLGLAAGAVFQPATAPWWRLLSVKSSGEFLYLRYGIKPGAEPES